MKMSWQGGETKRREKSEMKEMMGTFMINFNEYFFYSTFPDWYLSILILYHIIEDDAAVTTRFT